jgi:hypothetical protein
MKKPKPSDDPKTNPPKGPAKGYPVYPEKDDIYERAKEEKDLDPENLSRIKPANDKWEIDPEEELEIEGDLLADDLDVPGSELDDDQEDIGNEDEENNYYSIGGDNHENLEEDNQSFDLEEEDES